ncbi:hypothetical protein B7463_g5175, partial [Scytalidium lignicola]
MEVLIRESTFGRLTNYLTRGSAFPYPSSQSSSNSPYNSSLESSVRKQEDQSKLVDWSSPDDPEKPMNWSSSAKFVVMLEVMLLNFSFYAASAIFTPSIPGIEEEYGVGTAAGTLGLSLFVIAYGIGPLILSPLSNIPSIGRTPIYISGLFGFCLFQIGTALAKNIQTVLILRFFAGFIGSTPISVGGATLSEIYGPSHMPYAIAFYAVSGVCGPILGPNQVGHMESDVMATHGSFGFYASLLQSEIDMKGLSITKSISKQIIEDFKMSFADPIILFVNLHTMLIYGVLYLWFEFFPYVFAGIYGFTALQQALAFFGILIGAIISIIAYLLWLRFSYGPSAAKMGDTYKPEVRLLPGQIGAICIPICLFIFGWTSRPSVHWIAPIIGTAFFAPGFYLTFQSVLNYLGESYPRHVASVFAGNTFFRSFFGGALPLAAPAMLRSLGIGWASSVLAFISVALLPVPFILARYGERLRKWSSYAN